MKIILPLLLLSVCNVYSQSQEELFLILRERDSIMFEVGFNQCKVEVFEDIVASDFEFYHDQSGVITDKNSFIQGISEGLCNMDYRAIREVNSEDLEVYPLYNNGILYGALQKGFHSFYALYEGRPRELTSTALFSHLWILEDGSWKLKRVISYNHEAKHD